MNLTSAELRRLSVLAVGYVLLVAAGRSAGRLLGVELVLATGALLALGLRWGPVVAWAGAVGAFVVDLLYGALGAWTVASLVEPFVVVGLGRRLWGSFGGRARVGPPGALRPASVLEFGLVAATLALLLGAIDAWTAVLLRRAPFFAVVADRVPDAFASALVVGGVLLFVAPLVGERVDRATWSGLLPAPAEERSLPPTVRGSLVFAVAFGWCVVGFWTAMGAQALQVHRTQLLVNRFGTVVETALAIVGPGAIYLQFAIGCAAGGALLWLLRRSEEPAPEPA